MKMQGKDAFGSSGITVDGNIKLEKEWHPAKPIPHNSLNPGKMPDQDLLTIAIVHVRKGKLEIVIENGHKVGF